MSHSPGEEGGPSEDAPNVDTQEQFDNPTQTVAAENTPEDQVRGMQGFCICVSLCCLSKSVSWIPKIGVRL